MPLAPLPTVSVCIANHNYARFVERAVDSALGQTLTPVEVVVVDDGSTDDSVARLRAYGDRIRLVEQENRGHIATVNTAYAASTGDVVVFLDADDLLAPTALERVAAAVRPGTAKVQWRLTVVDEHDQPRGVFPHRLLPLDSGDLTGLLCAHGDYVGPVSSGNAYTRRALDAVMPLDGGTFDARPDSNGPDGYLNSTVPFHGTVESLDEPLGSYRAHSSNHSVASGGIELSFVRWRVQHELKRAAAIRAEAAVRGLRVHPDVMCANPEHVLLRVLSLRLAPQAHPVPGDRLPHLVAQAVTRARRSAVTPAARRAVLVAACLAAAVGPRRSLPGLAGAVLVSARRPRALRALATVLGR